MVIMLMMMGTKMISEIEVYRSPIEYSQEYIWDE